LNFLKEARNLPAALPVMTQAHILGRFLTGVFPQIVSAVPADLGRTLDFGCGHGLLLNLLKRNAKIDEGLGIDIDSEKIELAQRWAIAGVEFRKESLADVSGPFDTIISADVMYLLPLGKWSAVLARFYDLLRPGGRLIIKTVLKKNNWKHLWGCLQEQIAVRALRITEQQGSEFTYLTASEWREILERHGFQIDQFREILFSPYNHALFICRRPS
jgi:2-polyprenyl-3-methyl-5-hydroxy-6-metoxy-1,4-benzoquinol methylase